MDERLTIDVEVFSSGNNNTGRTSLLRVLITLQERLQYMPKKKIRRFSLAVGENSLENDDDDDGRQTFFVRACIESVTSSEAFLFWPTREDWPRVVLVVFADDEDGSEREQKSRNVPCLPTSKT